MRTLQATELSRLQSHQQESLNDTCVIHSYADGSADTYGLPAADYTEGSAIACGYKSRSSREVQEGNETVIVDAVVRLPSGTAITSKDRVEITKRFGTAIDPTLLFYVVGQPAAGPSGIVVSLRRVTDE